MRRDWTQFLPKLSEHPWLPCTWRGRKEPALARAPQTQRANGIKQMPPPLQTGLVQQLFKVNSVSFSNPKRILKPLLICLPFCFVCSAPVKGNLTFGILTANNPHQGQACCCSVSMWLPRMAGTFQLSAEGPRRHTAWGTRQLPPGQGCTKFAELLSTMSRAGRKEDAMLDECMHTNSGSGKFAFCKL